MQAQDISTIEESLGITIPDELKSIWSETPLPISKRELKYGAYQMLYFLYPNDKLKQFNGSEKGVIQFSEIESNDSKILTFATSLFEQHWIDVYYKFDSIGKVEGIFVRNGDQGSLTPVKIGESIDEVFPNLKACFKISNRPEEIEYNYRYQNDEFLFSDTTAVFPKKNLIQELIDIVGDNDKIVFYSDKDLSDVEDSEKLAINNLYDRTEIKIDFDNPYDLSKGYDVRKLLTFINAQNIKTSNDNHPNRVFNIDFRLGDKLAVCILNKEQAKAVNRLGLIVFDWRDRAIKEDKFMYK